MASSKLCLELMNESTNRDANVINERGKKLNFHSSKNYDSDQKSDNALHSQGKLRFRAVKMREENDYSTFLSKWKLLQVL